jgi:hypothetical protein
MHYFPFGLCSSFAGNVEVCNAVVSRLGTALEAHPPNLPMRLDYLMNALEGAGFAEWQRIVDAEMKRHLVMSLQEWQQMSEASLLYRRGQRLVNRTALPVEMIIGGIVLGSATIVHVPYMDIPRADWLACVGTGGDAAYTKLTQRSQHAHMTIPRTMLHVLEALNAAREAEPNTVGAPSDFIVITARQTRRMPANSPVLQRMLDTYGGTDNTEGIDSSTEIWNEVQAAMYTPGITKEQYNAGIREPTRSGARTSAGPP